MALITIGGVTPVNPKGYSVTPKKIEKEVQNSKGDTFIDYINTKDVIDIAWGCLPQEDLTAIASVISQSAFTVTYTDNTGAIKTGTFRSSDPKYSMLVYIAGKPIWADLAITMTEL